MAFCAVDGRSDVYSLGAVLYEALTGAPPFEGDHQTVLLYSIINVDPEPLSACRDDPDDFAGAGLYVSGSIVEANVSTTRTGTGFRRCCNHTSPAC